MDDIDYAKELGIRSAVTILRGVSHADQRTMSNYCVYEPKEKKFKIFMEDDDPLWELHGLGQVKSHELGFPALTRLMEVGKETQEEAQIYDGTNTGLQIFFQDPHIYSVVERFMSQSDWEKTFGEPLSKFEAGIEHYGSTDFGDKRYLAAFAVAHMALQTAEILLSARRYSEGQVARTESCMEAIDRLQDKGIPLRENFWDRAITTLEPYYARTQEEYTDGMEGDFIRMANLILPNFIAMNIYTGPTNVNDGKIRPIPGLEIPNWIIEYRMV